MKELATMVTGIPEFQRLAAAVDGGGCPAAFTGLSPVHRAHMAAGLRQALGRSVVVLCADEAEADRMARDLAFLTGEQVRTLTAAGYTRCEQVEGVGQFALRGGILDFYSPAEDGPIRVEFFGDEADSMGLFDVNTQRRVENRKSAEILPAAEVLPQFAPGGYAGLLEAMDGLIARAKRRKDGADLVKTLEEDKERLAENRSFPALDRYIALVYPHMATAADYFPEDAVVLFSESPRVAERAKN